MSPWAATTTKFDQLRELGRSRPMTGREIQVQSDRVFFQQHRPELQAGQHWAGRGKDGQLHLMPHSSAAADMMMAVDQATRVEQQPQRYLAGELKAEQRRFGQLRAAR